MKIQKKNFYTLLLTFISIFFGVHLWKIINIPYHHNGIIGQYSLNNYNSLNDPIKYLTFIILPIFTFLLCKIYIEKKKFIYLLFFFKQNEELKINKDINLNTVLFVILILICIQFFSLDFSYHKIDIFHAGQKLNPAYKSYFDNSLWSGSYLTGGLFNELLNTKLIWNIFNHQSIGLMRFFETFLILITKILILILALQISKTIKLEKYLRLFFFVLLSYFFLNFIDYDINSADLIESREIPNLFFLIFSLIYIRSNNDKFKISFIVLGFFSVFSFFWSVDRAIIYNLLLISLIIYFIVNNKFYSSLYILFFSFVSWLISFFILQDEFLFFISNTLNVISEINDIHGIIHPIPFSNETNSTRATKTLLAILFSLLISFNLILKKNSFENHHIKIFLTLLSLLSFFSYVYALGRSDGGHIRQALGYPLIFFILFILFFLVKFINNNYIYKFKNSLKLLPTFIFFLILILNFNLNFENIRNYKNNFINYVYANDFKFLKNDDIKFVKQASFLLQSEKCIDLYTYDSPILYLIKKPSCSRFNFLWSLGSEKNQEKFINDLENTNVIITNGETDGWGQIPFNIKYPLLDKYISLNYTKELYIFGRKIKFKKNN